MYTDLQNYHHMNKRTQMKTMNMKYNCQPISRYHHHHHSSLFGVHHQCVAPLAANSPHSGLSRAISIASSKVRLCRDMSFFRVAIQEEWGRPTGLLQSLWGTAVRIRLASADSSIMIRCPNSMSFLFCMIKVRRGCSVRRPTSQLET